MQSRIRGMLARRRFPKALQTTLVTGTALVGVMGCSGDPAVAPYVDDPFVRLELNAENIVMSIVPPYDTLRLTVTPYTASGHVLTTAAAPTFRTADASLDVSPDGLIKALKTTSANGTTLTVTMTDTAHGITRTATVLVRVTNQTPAAPLQSLTVVRPPNDSAKLGATSDAAPRDTMRVVALDANGDNITSSLLLRYTSSDPTIASVGNTNGIIKGESPGRAVIRVSTTYYGVTKVAELPITIGNPLSVRVSLPIVSSKTTPGEYIREFLPSTITIGVGGTVTFTPQFIPSGNPAHDLVWDVVFDDPAAAQSSWLPPATAADGTGNIGPVPSFSLNGQQNPECQGAMLLLCVGARRAFYQPGVYTYRSALYGTTGKIIVVADSPDDQS